MIIYRERLEEMNAGQLKSPLRDEIEELDTDLTREKNDPGASAYTRLKSAVSSGKRTRVEPVVLKTVRAKEGAGGK